jgi:hypothetical protein
VTGRESFYEVDISSACFFLLMSFLDFDVGPNPHWFLIDNHRRQDFMTAFSVSVIYLLLELGAAKTERS